MLHDAVVIDSKTSEGKKSGVFVPCDSGKEARELAKYLNDRLREAEPENQKNGATHEPDRKEEKPIVLPPVPEVAEP